MALFDTSKKIYLTVTSGKQFLNMGIFSTAISMKKDEYGNIFLGNLQNKFEILEYNWEGARYQTTTNTISNETTKGTSKEKEHRKGRVAGAVIGTMLLPGVGTAIGASLGTGKKSKGKTNSDRTGTSSVTTSNVEVKSNATLKFRNLDTGEVFVIGIRCDSKTDAELQNFCIPRNMGNYAAEVSQQKSNVKLLKEYKELLDMGIITEDEFQKKKQELLF